MAAASITLNDITKHFENLADPRSQININRFYSLPDIVVFAIMAILSGANGPTAIAGWAHHHRDFLLAQWSLPNSIPATMFFATSFRDWIHLSFKLAS